MTLGCGESAKVTPRPGPAVFLAGRDKTKDYDSQVHPSGPAMSPHIT